MYSPTQQWQQQGIPQPYIRYCYGHWDQPWYLTPVSINAAEVLMNDVTGASLNMKSTMQFDYVFYKPGVTTQDSGRHTFTSNIDKANEITSDIWKNIARHSANTIISEPGRKKWLDSYFRFDDDNKMKYKYSHNNSKQNGWPECSHSIKVIKDNWEHAFKHIEAKTKWLTFADDIFKCVSLTDNGLAPTRRQAIMCTNDG